MEQKTTLIKFGDFFFKYRNSIFPLAMIALFFSFRTSHELNGSEGLDNAHDLGAIFIVLCGLALRLAVIGFRYIKRGGFNRKVYAEKLVTDGLFGVCRNPLYVANISISAGILLMHGATEVLILGTAFFLFVYIAIVAAEEYFLRNEFGASYAEYCKDVPRWGFRPARLSSATEGMQFDLKSALAKDYSTIANAIVTMTLLELMEQVQWHSTVWWELLGGMIVATIVVAYIIHILKDRNTLDVA